MKGKSQNGYYKKTKHAKFSEKRTFHVQAVCMSGGQKCLLFWKIWRDLFSCNTRFEICPFALLPKSYGLNLQHSRFTHLMPLISLYTPNSGILMFSRCSGRERERERERERDQCYEMG